MTPREETKAVTTLSDDEALNDFSQTLTTLTTSGDAGGGSSDEPTMKLTRHPDPTPQLAGRLDADAEVSYRHVYDLRDDDDDQSGQFDDAQFPSSEEDPLPKDDDDEQSGQFDDAFPSSEEDLPPNGGASFPPPLDLPQCTTPQEVQLFDLPTSRIVIVRELIAEFTPEVQFVRLIPAVTPRMFRQDFLVGEERSRPITPIEVVLDHYETHRQNYEEERRREQAAYERRCEEFRAAYREEALRAQRAAGRRASSEASALGSAEVASGASASVVEDLLFSDLRVGSVPSTSSFGPPASIDCASPADASRQFPRPRDIEALLPSAPPALACNKGRDWLRAALRLSEGPAYERRHPSPGGDVHAIAHEDKPVCEALWTALESRCGHGTEVSATMALYSEEHGRNPFGLLDELDKIVTKVSSAGCWKALQTFVTYRMASRSTAAQHVERVYADAEAIEKGGVTLPPRLINFVAIQSLDSRYEGLKQKCEHDPDYAEKVSDKSRFALLRLLSDQNVPSDYPRGGSGRSRSRSPAPSAASAALSVGVESLSTADLTKLIKRCKGNKNFTQALWGAGCVEHATQAAQQLAKMKRDKGKEKENRRRRDPRRGDEDAAGTADDA